MGGNDLVGRNVRRIRAQRRLTMSALAAQAGLSKQTLSKIEMGEANPTVETLESISGALHVKAGDLLTEWGSAVSVQRAAGAVWDETGPVPARRLAETYGSGYVRSFLLKLHEDDDEGQWTPASPGSLVHLYVISGEVQAGALDAPVTIGEGDFVRFPADDGHACRSTGGHALVHVVLTIPQLPQTPPA